MIARPSRGRRARRPNWALGIVIGGAALLLMLALAARAATMGDAQRGRAHAQAVCAECHAFAPGDRKAGYADATAFQVLADRPGTTELSLRAFLRSLGILPPPEQPQPRKLRDADRLSRRGAPAGRRRRPSSGPSPGAGRR